MPGKLFRCFASRCCHLVAHFNRPFPSSWATPIYRVTAVSGSFISSHIPAVTVSSQCRHVVLVPIVHSVLLPLTCSHSLVHLCFICAHKAKWFHVNYPVGKYFTLCWPLGIFSASEILLSFYLNQSSLRIDYIMCGIVTAHDGRHVTRHCNKTRNMIVRSHESKLGVSLTQVWSCSRLWVCVPFACCVACWRQAVSVRAWFVFKPPWLVWN